MSVRHFTLLSRLSMCVVAILVAAAPVRGQTIPSVDPRVAEILSEISPDRMEEYLTALVGFEQRHTMSVLDGPGGDTGIIPAREYILETFRSFSPRLRAEFDCYDIRPVTRISQEIELCNVMAVLPGRSERRIYVSGHYDTVARRADTGSFDWDRWDNPSPGANDDGSGTVLTMELARVLAQSGVEFDATLVFLALAGEEEGLVGATLHAQNAVEDSIVIDAVFNHDIIGNSTGGNGIVDSRSLRVFSEDPMDSMSRQMARYIRRFATIYVPGHIVKPIAREDRFGRGGDHTAFNRFGYPGVRFSESRENYSMQHTENDVIEGVDFDYLARNARVSAASVATLALAPPSPELGGLGRGDGYDAAVQWRPSPGADAYRVVWREAWGPDWDNQIYVDAADLEDGGRGRVGITLPDLSIDGYIFGVAAVGPDGHESLVRPFVRPPRRVTPIPERGGN
ncbi:MAG TPA: M20/M25/M40 family metallo-hydrolase [Longimicrobiales bacterium]|nr:M20/M25/M40 family metallo-hydrolase [Longimicrobiales bacterium]